MGFALEVMVIRVRNRNLEIVVLSGVIGMFWSPFYSPTFFLCPIDMVEKTNICLIVEPRRTSVRGDATVLLELALEENER